jgi:hypothetical protein
MTVSAAPERKKLIVSTLVALLVAALLLVTIVLPAEYDIDPTRIGKLLGLTGKHGCIASSIRCDA